MHVTYDGGAFRAKRGDALREIREYAFGLGCVGDAIDADVDYGGAGRDVIGSDHGGASHGGDDDIGAADSFGEVARFRMADGDGGVGVHEEKRHGLADDVAAAEDGCVFAFDWNFAAAQNFHHAERGAGDEIGASGDEAADVEGMEAVDIFGGIDGFEDFLGVNLCGKRKLDEDAVDVVAAIEIFDDGEQFAGADCSGRGEVEAGEAEFFAGCDFAGDVDFGGGIFTDENGGEAGADSGVAEGGDFAGELRVDLIADGVAVEDASGQSGSRVRFFAGRVMIAQRFWSEWSVTDSKIRDETT